MGTGLHLQVYRHLFVLKNDLFIDQFVILKEYLRHIKYQDKN